MTGKALRKKRQQKAHPRQPNQRLGQGQAWLAVGAFVASATLAPHAAGAADRIPLFARRQAQGAPAPDAVTFDARLKVVDEAVRARSSARQAETQASGATLALSRWPTPPARRRARAGG